MEKIGYEKAREKIRCVEETLKDLLIELEEAELLNEKNIGAIFRALSDLGESREAYADCLNALCERCGEYKHGEKGYCVKCEYLFGDRYKWQR